MPLPRRAGPRRLLARVGIGPRRGDGRAVGWRTLERCRRRPRRRRQGLAARRLRRRDRPFRRALLRDDADRRARDGPATEALAGDDLAGARRCGDRSGQPEGQPYRDLCRHRYQRIPRPDVGGRRREPQLSRHCQQHRCRQHRVQAGPHGADDAGDAQLCGIAGHGSAGGRGFCGRERWTWRWSAA